MNSKECSCNEPYGDFICPVHNINVHTGESIPNSKLREILESVVDWAESGRTSMGRPNALEPDEAEKAIRQAVGEEMLELIDAEIEASKKNLAYAEENNHSDRAIANWRGCIEGEMFCRQKIKEWAAHQGEHLMKPKTIDEILDKFRLHCDMAWSEVSDGVYTSKDFHETAYPKIKSEAKAQIQQLLEECAPERFNLRDTNIDYLKYAERAGHNQAIDQYKSNLMEKLK